MSPLSETTRLLKLKRDTHGELADVALVALQHLLPSIPPLFARFVEAGIAREHIFLMGKPYSTVPSVGQTLREQGLYVHLPEERSFNFCDYTSGFVDLVAEYWYSVRARLPRNIKRITILDEGGWLCRGLPKEISAGYELTAVEHTMSGLNSMSSGGYRCPVILMAASAAKTRFEGAVIADAIVERLQEAIPNLAELRIGVIGLGNLGQAVATTLHEFGFGPLCGYDKNESKSGWLPFVRRLRNASELVELCDVVLGCAGQDVLEPGAALHNIKARRWLASCSSGDIEFLRTAQQLARRVPAPRSDPFRDARGRLGDTEVILLNGGFPLNFDRTREREPPSRIQLTREITYASVLQAMLCIDSTSDAAELMLDPDVQQALVTTWLAHADAAALFPNWIPHPVGWWEKHSAGQRSSISLSNFIEPVVR